MKPHVSVVVATYNRSDLLRENLDAVLGQDDEGFEVIYVDDGSTDNTPEVLEEYRARHPNLLTTLRVPNGGQGKARNEGARIARGELLLFTDDDTIPPRDWVSGMRAGFLANSCDAMSGGFTPFSMQDPVERYLHYRERILFADRPKYVTAAPAMNFIIPRELFWEENGFIAEPMEDWVLCRNLARRGRKIYYDPAVKVIHHYQSDWRKAVQRIRTPAIRGLYIRYSRGQWGFPYVVYTAGKFLSSPVWSLWRFPADLYGMSIRMEGIYFRERLKAYMASFLDRTLTTPH